MESTLTKAQKSAQQLAARLQELDQNGTPHRVVFAESCTAGLVAALLGQVPGISNYLCGSAVTYRGSVKQDWLGVSAEIIEAFTTESIETTKAMALGVLQKTDEAGYSAAITGHLGPDAPLEIDGKIFVAVAACIDGSAKIIHEQSTQLLGATRTDRQYEAASIVLGCMFDAIGS